jgi:glycine/D-amino acid oxidase-like deaminating enzyme
MADSVFAEDCRFAPYWWDATPRPPHVDVPPPGRVDVAVIGSGYTGLHAALQTARGGRSTVVLDAEDAGWGCSTRNGGQISTSIKPDYEELAQRHGPQRAMAILQEGKRSLEWIGEFIRSESMACDFRISGRFHAAHSPRRYEALARHVAALPKELGIEAHVVARSEQRHELGTEAYHGGVVFTQHAALDPARYHAGLLDRARAAGAAVISRCPVTGIDRDGQGFRLFTRRGEVHARDVVVATNGYSGTLVPWLSRRVIPIGSYIIATEPVPRELMAKLMPKDRTVSDTRRVVYYYRASPDRRRILFGGRVSGSETDPRLSGPLLHRDMVAIFPELASVKITHSWLGIVAYTFDTLMHIGCHNGLHYAMGYCGSGVGMASYLGMRLGLAVMGSAEGKTAFDGLNFPTRPLYSGRPWFLAPTVLFYRLLDRMDR